jgi:selenocysteine-specific elongation factor
MQAVVVGTAGHIDHGKSALVRALTGIDPDRLKEEQVRGITIDLGFAHLTLGDVQLAFVDVPGHERFVRNMLAWAGGIDAVMLIVAATESVKPQTREHFEICRLLGLERGLIAVTKADLADAAQLARADADCRDLVAGSFLEGAPILHVSSVTGQGLDDLRGALGALAGHPPRLHRSGVVRLPVDRVFTVKGFGVVVTGTLVSGAVAAGDALVAMPAGTSVRIRGLQVHGQSVNAVTAPQRVAMNLTGVEAASLGRGVTIATPGSFAATSRADVHVQLLPDARPLAHGARIRVHHGTMEALARISIAAVRSDRAAPWQAARAGDSRVEVPPGGEAFARLRFGAPVVLTRGDRLILRAASPVSTIGGARVLDPAPAGSGVRRETALARFAQFETDEAAGVVRALLTESAGRGLGAEGLVRRAGLDPDEAAELQRCVGAGQDRDRRARVRHAGRKRSRCA